MPALQTTTGRTIFYDSYGAGPPLILLMGGGESRWMWADQIPALTPTFRVMAPDNRDSGESPSETTAYTIVDLADDIVSFMDALGLARATFVGTSLGGMIALQIALDYPTRVERLILLSTPAGGVHLAAPPYAAWSHDHADMVRAVFPMLAAPGHFEAHPATLEQLAERGRENNLTYDGLVRQLNVINTFDVRNRLWEVVAPTLLVVGDHDSLIPTSEAKAFGQAMPNCRVVVIQGAGHLAFVERPGEVNRAILEFLHCQPADRNASQHAG